MTSVSLFYVGAALLLNGLASLGFLPVRGAALMNIFVGLLQCTVPLLVLAHPEAGMGENQQVFPLFLFGFTYLSIGISDLAGLPQEGTGWFALFVAGAAGYLALDTWSDDAGLGVLWMAWAALWVLLFSQFALHVKWLSMFTGWLTVLWALPTTTVPAALMLSGRWVAGPGTAWLALSVLALLAAVAWVAALQRWSGSAGRHRPYDEALQREVGP